MTDASIDTAARAAFEFSQSRGNWQGHSFDDDDMVNVRKAYRELARDVLIAVREPSDAMLQAGDKKDSEGGYETYAGKEFGPNAPRIWKAMIDVLIEEAEGRTET